MIQKSIRQELRDVVEIQNIGGMESYLGLPENMGCSKTLIFNFVQDR